MLRALVILLVAATGWLYWDGRIPGLPLTSWQVDRFLAPDQSARRIRMALGQVKGAHPALPALRQHPEAVVRAEVARLAASVDQLEDRSPWVRLRAGLALAKKEPVATRPVLLASLRPFTVFAAEAGPLAWRLAEGARVEMDEELGTLNGVALLAPLPGRLVRRYAQSGDGLRVGQRVGDVAIAEEWELAILGALGGIGIANDVDELRGLLSQKYPTAVRQAAAAAIEAIEKRTRKNP